MVVLNGGPKTLSVHLFEAVVTPILRNDMQSLFSTPGCEVIKLFSGSIQLSMKIFRLINVKMPTIVGILTFVSRKKKHSRLI